MSNILLRIRRIVEGAQEEYDIMVAEDKVRGIPLDICAFDVTKLNFFQNLASLSVKNINFIYNKITFSVSLI